MQRKFWGLVLALGLGGCSGGLSLSDLNPMNLLPSVATAEKEAAEAENASPVRNASAPELPADATLVSDVSRPRLDRTPSGGILRVDGLSAIGDAPRRSVLIPARAPDSAGTLRIAFATRPGGSEASAHTANIVGAVFLSRGDLRAVSQLEVIGSDGSAVLRLR